MVDTQRQRFRLEWIALAAVLAIAALVTIWMLAGEHQAIRVQEAERLQGQARVVNENLIRQLAGANKALKRVRDDFAYRSSTADVVLTTTVLKSLTEAMPGVGTMLLQDRDGTVVAASRDDFIGKDFAARPYFQVPRDGRDPNVLYVSAPFKTILGTFVVVVGRVVTDIGGEFAGVVTASLDPNYFKVLMGSVRYAPDVRTTLFDGDGGVFLSLPADGVVDHLDRTSPDSPFTRFRSEGMGAMLTTGAMDAISGTRLTALRRIDDDDLHMDRPLLVAVSRDLAAVEQPWRNKAALWGGAIAAISLLLGVGSLVDQRRRAALARAAAIAADERTTATAAVRASEDQLRELTDNMPALVSRLDLDQRFRFANRAYHDWLGLEPASLIGRSLKEVFGGDAYGRFEHHVAAALTGERIVYEREMQMLRGTRRVEVTLIPQHGEDGVLRGLDALIVDISARFEADRQNVRSEERLSLAMEGSGLALFDWDIAQDRIYQSAQAAVMRGRPPEATTTSGAAMRAAVHPDDIESVMTQIADVVKGRAALFRAEFRLARGPGEWAWVRAQGRVFERDPDGRARRVAGTFADIGVEKAAEGQLRRLAEIDDLTGLPNRAVFNERLEQALTRVTPQSPMALLFLDIDRFKEVNDGHGHEAGDDVLKAYAKRMLAVVRKADTVARLAGDEFTIILEGLNDPQDARLVAGKLLDRLRVPIELSGRPTVVTASIGIASCETAPSDAVVLLNGMNDAAALLRRADAALYEAKRRGRDSFFYDDGRAAMVAPDVAG